MKISKWLVSLAFGAILSSQLALAASASAQDAATAGSEGSHGANIATSPSIQTPPTEVAGCWSGSIDDDAFGLGNGFFQFGHKGNNPKQLSKSASRFDFEWPSAYAYAPIAGAMKGAALKVHGNAFQCPVTFIGVVNQAGNEITGTYAFSGKCKAKDGFAQGTFDVVPSGC
jgi:hypothetical protein